MGVRGLPFVWAKLAHASQGKIDKWGANAYLKVESHLRSAPVAASTLSGKRRHGAESARGAGRHFDPCGEAAPRREVCCCKTLAPVVCHSGVYFGVCTGRGLTSARGAAEAEAPEMSIYLGARERLRHKVCWVLCAQHLI